MQVICVRDRQNAVRLFPAVTRLWPQESKTDYRGSGADKNDYYLSGKHMEEFNEKTFAIANAWLDPQVGFLMATLRQQ